VRAHIILPVPFFDVMPLGSKRRQTERALALMTLKQKIMTVHVFQISCGSQKASDDWQAAIGTGEQEHVSEAQF
jgi:hypothetical protein